MTEKSNKTKDKVSFSELVVFQTCPRQHYLKYVKKLDQDGSVHLVAGNAIHNAIDRSIRGKVNPWISMGKKVYRWIEKNPIDKWQGELNPKEWVASLLRIYREVFDWLEEEFGQYEVVESELRLKEPVEDLKNMNFKGYIDLIIKDEKGTYHVIDFKLCSWGWDKYKRRDTHKQYQISLYKHYFCQKEGVDPKKVKTHFALLKRKPGKKQAWACELFTISSGPKKLNNANDWLKSTSKRIKKGFSMPKVGKHCKLCDFANTKHCPVGKTKEDSDAARKAFK